MYELQLVGGGRMGEALIGGLLSAGTVEPARVVIVERVPERRDHLVEAFPGVAVVSEPVECSGAIVATKPADVVGVLAALGRVGVRRVLSIAAGIGLASMEAAAGADVRVVRAMPNTPALVGAGAAAIAGGPTVDEHDLAWAESILGSVGTVVRVDEPSLDAVTGLSGSGPAYVFLLAEAMIDAGVQSGLSPAVAGSLVRQTLLGSARLLAEGDATPSELRAAVTSPGGTTAAGVAELTGSGMPDAVHRAVRAATERSRELGA